MMTERSRIAQTAVPAANRIIFSFSRSGMLPFGSKPDGPPVFPSVPMLRVGAELSVFSAS